MASGGDIPAPICETKRELDEATNKSINTLPQEEKTIAGTPSVPSIVEGDNFLKTPSISEVHLEVSYNSSNPCKSTEKPNQIVIDNTEILLLRDPKLDDQQSQVAVYEGAYSKRIELNTEESSDAQMEHDKELEKISEKLPPREVSTGGTNDNEPEVKDKNEELDKVELFENEKNTIGLLKEETEKFVESLHVVLDNSNASNLNLHEIVSDITEEKIIDQFETHKEVLESSSTIVSSSPEEGIKNAVLQGVNGTHEITIDKVDVQKEALQNLSTIGSNEEPEEKPIIKVDASETNTAELLEKESKITFSPQPLASRASDNESMAMHEGRIEDGEVKTLTVCEIEKCTETKLLEKEPKIEKPEDSSSVASEEIKASDLDHGKIKSSLEEQTAIAHLLEILERKTGDEALDAAETNDGTLETVATCASTEKIEEKPLIQVDSRQKKIDDLEKDSEKPSLIEDVVGNTNDDEFTVTDDVDKAKLLEKEKNTESNSLKEEVHDEKLVQFLPLADNKASDLGQNTDTTGFLEDQRLTENPQGTLTERTEEETDGADTEKRTQEQQNVAINVSNEDNDLNSSIQLDPSQMKHDKYLEKDIEKPQFIEASAEDINHESTVMNEAEIGNEPIRKVGLRESDKDIDTTLLKKGNLQEAPEKHEPSRSSEDIETTCSSDEQSITANPQSIMSEQSIDATDTTEHAATKVPYKHTDENVQVQVDCSQTEYEEHLAKKESDNLCLAEALLEETNDSKSKVHEHKGSDDLRKAELLKKEINIVSTVVKEEAQVEKHIVSFQATPDDIKASNSAHDTNISTVEEEIQTANPGGLSNDKREETADEAANLKTLELQNVATTTACEDTEKKSLIQVDGSQLKHLESESENTPLTEAPARDISENILAKEEAEIEKPTEYEQVVTEDIKVDRQTCSIAEQIPIANPQEISSENIEEKTTDAAYTKYKTLEDVTTNVSNDNQHNLPTEVDGLQNPALVETSVGNTDNDETTNIHEDKFVDESLTKDKAFEDEKNKESTSMEKEVYIVNLQKADEDIKEYASCQDRETTSLEEQGSDTNPERIKGGKEGNTSDTTKLEEETPKNKNAATTIPQEDNEENSTSQVDSSQMEQKEHVEKKSQNSSLTEKMTDETIGSILKEETDEEKLIESFQIASEDNEVPASDQDTEIRFKEEQVPPDSQEISCDKKEDKTTHTSYAQEKYIDVKEPSFKEASTGTSIDVEPPPTHEHKFEDENLVKADRIDAEKCTEGILENEKPSIEASQETETSSLEVQSLTTNSQEMSHHEEDKTVDAAELEPKNPQDKNIVTTVPYEVAEENSLIQAEKGSAKSYLTEAQTGRTTESALLKEAPEIEKRIESAQVPTGNIKTSSLSQDTDKNSIEQQILTVDQQEISGDKTKEIFVGVTDTKEKILKVQDTAITVPSDNKENYSPTTADGSQNRSLTEVSTENTIEVQNIAINVASGDKEASLPKEVDGLQNPYLTEVSTGNIYEVQDIATNTPSGNNKDNCPTNVDASSTENPAHHESRNMHGHGLADESLRKADEVENEKHTDDTSVKGKISDESLKITTEDIKACASGQDREPSSQEDQSLIADPEIMDGDREGKTTEASDLKEETFKERTPITVAAEIPYKTDSDVDTDMVVYIAEDPKCKEHVANATSSTYEPSEQDLDKTDTEKMTVLSDGSTKIPIKENLVETDPIEADTQVLDEENKAESKQQDTETGASQDVSDSSTSVALEEVSSCSVASQNDPTSNPSLKSEKERPLEAKNEEAQKQDEDLNDLAPVHDSKQEKIEKDVQLCPASAAESKITHQMQKLGEAPLPAPNTIDNTDCMESEIVEDGEKLTAREQEGTECKQEKVHVDEAVEEIKEPSSSTPVANDLLQKSFTGTSELNHSTAERQLIIHNEDLQTGKTPTGDHEETKFGKDKEEEACEQKISNLSCADPTVTVIQTSDKDSASSSTADLDAKIDDEAPEIMQSAYSATESHEVESISVIETSTSIAECERGVYEYEHIGNEEKKDSNEVVFSPEEGRSEHETKTQGLESIDRVQSYGMIFKAQENLTAAAETKEDDEDVRNDHIGYCKEKVITESHLEEQVKQEEKTNIEEIIQAIKNPNETEKVPEDPEETVDRAGEETREKLQANEPIERSIQKEQEKNDEDVIEVSHSRELHGLDQSYINTGAHDSREEVNRSTEASREDEEKSKGDDGLDNGMTKDEALLNLSSNVSVEDVVSGEQPEEFIICEAPPAETVSKIIEDDEGKKDDANTIMKQHQAEDSKNEHESNPLPVCTQVQESEKQAPKDEACSSDEVQSKDEVHQILSAGKKESGRTDSQIKPTEDEDQKTYVEAEKVDFPTHTDDKIKASQYDAALDVPADDENSTTKTENLETSDSCEGQDTKAIPKAPMSEIPKQEIEHIVLEADHTKNIHAEISVGNKNISVIEDEHSAEYSHGEHELQKNSVLEPEKAICEHEEKTSHETRKSIKESESKEVDKSSLSDLFQLSTKETSQTASHSADEKEPTTHIEDLEAEKHDEAEHEDIRTDEEKDDEESSEQKVSESDHEAPVIVDMGDAVAHKKSHNILSGVGSKVKHSIAKVKKAITGKSSHPKPPSPT